MQTHNGRDTVLFLHEKHTAKPRSLRTVSSLNAASTKCCPAADRPTDPSSVLCIALKLLSTQLYCPDSSACYTQAPALTFTPLSFSSPNSLSGAKTVGISQQANWGWKILYQSQWSRGMEQLREEARGRLRGMEGWKVKRAGYGWRVREENVKPTSNANLSVLTFR